MLSPATGYTFTNTSPNDWAQQNKQTANDAQTAYIGGGIATDGTGVTIQISRPGVHWDAPEIVSSMIGPPLRPVTLAGQQAWHGPAADGQMRMAFWSYGPALVTVSGADQREVDAVMTGIIKAMTSPPQGN